jgi:subfamily B ATP-binding cassette protein HlyB/CyaB
MRSALTALEIVAKLNRKSIDTRGIIKEYALSENEPTLEELTRIAKHQGFKAAIKKLPIHKIISSYPLPAIALKKDGTFMTILQGDPQKNELLIFEAGINEPKIITFDDFAKMAEGRIMVLKHKLLSDQVRFGLGWFYKQILSYKKIIGEVLLASFIIQLFGLVTPLFTQVILDKVLVHHSMSTLNILAIAFVIVTLFDFLLNLVRNYIFVHTTSKIDAKLGAKLFYHLMALPI